MMYWKGLERKWPWPNKGTILAFGLEGLRKIAKILVRIATALVRI
jgi:hypothetical protein